MHAAPLHRIHITPMIDILLVLLMIFIAVDLVIMTQVDLPVAVHADWRPEEPDEITLVIDRQGDAWLEVSGHAAPGVALREQLAALYRDRTRDRILYLKADSTLPFGVLEAAMLTARDAGVRVVAAVTERRVQPGM
jgi:biopolymer transport protein TolR